MAKALEAQWAEPGLTEGLRIEWSLRMSTSLGRCFPARRLIRINESALGQLPHLLEEVVCHELAHLAVYLRHGAEAQPHGPEWQALVEAAGYSPERRVSVDSPPAGERPRQKRGGWYEHRCPVCQQRRFARASTPRWRCAECVEDGLAGTMTVTKVRAMSGETP